MDRAALVTSVIAITRTGTRLWLDRCASLAAWLVAAGTVGLAAGSEGESGQLFIEHDQPEQVEGSGT